MSDSTGDNSGGVSLGDGSAAAVTRSNGQLSVIDPVTGVAVTVATVNPTDPQWAKQEASLIGNPTTAALTGLACPP